MTLLDRMQDVFSQVARPFYVLRAPIVAASIASVFLALPDQALEIYRVLALDVGGQVVQIALAFATLLLMTFFIWVIGRSLTLQHRMAEITSGGFGATMLRWLPRTIAVLPLVGAGFGLWRAAQGIPEIDVPDEIEERIPGLLDSVRIAQAQMNDAQAVLTGGAVGLFVVAVVFLLLTWLRVRRNMDKYTHPNPAMFGRIARWFYTSLAAVLTMLMVAYYFADPVAVSQHAGLIGALAIFNVFIICLSLALALLTNIYDRTDMPVISLLIGVALVATAFNWNDNHGIRTLDRTMLTTQAGPSKRAIERPQQVTSRKPAVGQAFEEWLEARPDYAYYADQGRPYPVYLVAAQGGGAYAAHHAATTLARLQDRCPAFAQHVFAMSGVSGGSLGTALFASLVKVKAKPVTEPKCQPGEVLKEDYVREVDAFLAKDFMAPLTAAGFFPDFLQRFIPYPIQPFDRARALEASFEGAWASAIPSADRNPFAEPFDMEWNPTALHPALILNATWVRTGERAVFAPFHFRNQTTDRIASIDRIVRRPIALSTAVGVSARFPWVLPAASWTVDPSERQARSTSAAGEAAQLSEANGSSYRKIRRAKREGREKFYRFVDGGYFEYSGVESARDVMQVIKDIQVERLRNGQSLLPISVQLIALTDDEIIEDARGSDSFASERRARESRVGFGEIGSPIETLLSTRLSRGNLSVVRVVDQLCPGCYRSRTDRRSLPGFDGDARLFRLNQTDFSLTLGWQLSPVTRQLVKAHTGQADKCFARPLSEMNTRARSRSAGRRGQGGGRENWFAKVINENNCAACRIMYDLEARPEAQDDPLQGFETTPVVRRHPYAIDVPADGGLLCR